MLSAGTPSVRAFPMISTQEEQRLTRDGEKWKRWGPYLSERQWGTVREDYSDDGNAWSYFSHDQARFRAYRWGEDGIAGYSDDSSQLCFALALWNGKDTILKERMFGLTNSEANHGEDVKEYYFYLDSTPTHSYMKYLYKYPQAAFPYDLLVRVNKGRTREDFEFELLDTGVFDQDRYFDVFVEYAKASPEDTLVKITAHNRGSEAATLHLLPTLWFRNTWSWGTTSARPGLHEARGASGFVAIEAMHADLGIRTLYAQGKPELLFTENETNCEEIFGTPNASPYVKDAFHNYVVHGKTDAINPARSGTKAAAHYILDVPALGTSVVRLRLTDAATYAPLGPEFEKLVEKRKQEADEFYEDITPDSVDADTGNVMRQALAGMLWSKQHYYLDVDRWLEEHNANPLRNVHGKTVRNMQWFHMVNDDVISMPDKWEYPWYAAWDLAFHALVLAMVDPAYAKSQLDLMLQALYLHPSGQIPAYEWNFGDVNPPVHAWATLRVYSMEKEARGTGDVEWLKNAFQKLLLNFTWWVNRKDPFGKNVFEGGFLGLDNIGVFDRSAPLPNGGFLEQADGTAWMALFCQNMLEIALELALSDPVYEEMAFKFYEHFLFIASAMDRIGDNMDEMWDEDDGFFYDLLRFPNGMATRLKVRSLVGLLALCATTVVPTEFLRKYPKFIERAERRFERMPELVASIQDPRESGYADRSLLAVMDINKLRRVLEKLLDENEFFGPHGIRSISKYHLKHPYVFMLGGQEFRVEYLPAESNSGMFGGNSNWRGPVWMPVNMLIVRALLQFYMYYGNEFLFECPTGSGQMMNLFEIAQELLKRLISTFTRGKDGRRPVYGGTEIFQSDPNWRDLILFFEYFNGDDGAGLGASHQTGWTGLVARMIQLLGFMTPHSVLEGSTLTFAKFYQDA